MNKIALAHSRGLLCLFLGLVGASGCGGSAPVQGSASLAWSITGIDRQPTTCEQVGAATVLVRLRNRAGDASAVSFPCGKSPSTTELLAGPYDVAFELRTVDGSTLAAGPDQTTVTVTAGQVTTLTPVTFVMDAKGSLALALATPPFTSNCKSATSGGAGITGNSITLERAAGGCAPVTFIRSRGGTQTGTYQVNCSSPLQAGCIETDETFTVPNMDPGAYIVRVRGQIAGSICWLLDGVLEVPPGSRVARTLNLTHFVAAGC
jgi:hypothetical protein